MASTSIQRILQPSMLTLLSLRQLFLQLGFRRSNIDIRIRYIVSICKFRSLDENFPMLKAVALPTCFSNVHTDRYASDLCHY